VQYKIADGSMKEIVVGSTIKVMPGYLPKEFDNAWMPVLKVDEMGPYCALENSIQEENFKVLDEVPVDINESSCISPQIILEVR
jgi:hypothetical protein